MKMLFTYTIIFSCNSLLSSREKSSWKNTLFDTFPATQQVLLPPPSNNKELATCKYSCGTLHVVVASKFAADDLRSGWLYVCFQKRQCTSLAIARSFSFAQPDQQVGGAVELACPLYWTYLSIMSQHGESLLIFPFDFWWKPHGFS